MPKYTCYSYPLGHFLKESQHYKGHAHLDMTFLLPSNDGHLSNAQIGYPIPAIWGKHRALSRIVLMLVSTLQTPHLTK